MKEENTYIFINAWTAPADDAGFEIIKIAFAAITVAFLTNSLKEPTMLIGVSDATCGCDLLGSLSPFLLVEDKNGDNYFVKKDEALPASPRLAPEE